MAAMATPEPNAPTLEQKSASPDVSREQKTELNGYAHSPFICASSDMHPLAFGLRAMHDELIYSFPLEMTDLIANPVFSLTRLKPPSSPKAAESEAAAPKVNGNGTKSDSNDGPNGVTATSEEGAASRKSEEAAPATETIPADEAGTKPDADSVTLPEAKAEAEKEEEKKEPEAPATVNAKKSEDVDMTDADAKPDTTEAITTSTTTATEPSTIEKPSSSSDAQPPKTEESKEAKSAGPKSSEPEEKKPADTGDAMAVDEKRESPATEQEQDVSTQGPEGMSQLNITDDAIVQSPVDEHVDVAMDDAAPTSSAKIARERDEDSGDEPLAKRAKTEPQEEVQVSTVTAELKNSKGLQGIENWNNTDLEKRVLTPYQMREMRRIIAGVKKTKNGMHFKDSVVKLWPTLAAAYLDKVEDPTDLGELERGLRDQHFRTLGDFKGRLSLIYKNTLTFNGEYHDITHAGLNVVETIWTKSLSVPEEEPPRSKATSKHMPSRHHEHRASAHHVSPPAETPTAKAAATPAAAERPPSKSKQAQANRRASSIATSPTDGPESQTFALPPGGVPQIRRASTNADGDRPKRAIHPPKSKDIDYSSKSSVSKKNLKPEIQFCDEVLREIMDEKHFHLNAAFLVPVDPVALGIPTYFNIIKKPMDLSTIAAKLNAGEYTHPKQFQGDMDLMFNNCFKFNTAGTPVHVQGKQLRSLFQSEMAKKDQWLANHASSKAGSTASDLHSDEESEAEAEVSVGGGDAAVLAATIATLQEKLQEETTKLNQLYMEDLPNEALIRLQSTVLSTVQQSLLAEKQKFAAMRSEKPAKARPSKPSKAKGGAGGGGGGRKSTAPAVPKKSGGGAKKPAKKERSWGAAERNQIANALSDPSYPSIEQAISIIKKDTGQAVSSNSTVVSRSPFIRSVQTC